MGLSEEGGCDGSFNLIESSLPGVRELAFAFFSFSFSSRSGAVFLVSLAFRPSHISWSLPAVEAAVLHQIRRHTGLDARRF